MDPETLQATVRGLVGRELTQAEAARICEAAQRMVAGAAPILLAHPGGVPGEDFAAVLRALANPGETA